ncbi:hypothetical protein JCM16138_09730 [Thermococcus atlanticus]
MRTGIRKLDILLGDLEPGSTILIETVGTLGEEIATSMLLANRGNAVAFVTPKLSEEFEKQFGPGEISLIVLGRDVQQQELYQISFTFRKMLKGSCVAFFILHPILVFHPPEIVFKLFAELVEIVREKKAVMMVLIDKRLVDERTLAMFENYASHIIDILEVVEGFKVTRGIRIKKSPLGGTGFYRLDISNGEVKIGEPLE